MRRHAFAGKSLKAFVLTAAFCATSLGGQQIAAQQLGSSGDPEQLAAAIARTMNATKPSTSAGAPITQQFSSHGSTVESRTTFRDAAAFANAISRRSAIQEQSARYMCQAERRLYIKKGVVFQDRFDGPDATKAFSFIIDERACASLAAPVIADAATLQKLVDGTAQQLTTAFTKGPPFPGSSFKAIAVKGDTIEVTNLITAPAFVDFFKFKGHEIRGRTQGFLCSKLGDAVRQGVKIRMIYKLDRGAPVLEFPIDNSVC